MTITALLKWRISLYCNDWNVPMLTIVEKNVMKIWTYENIEKPVAGT